MLLARLRLLVEVFQNVFLKNAKIILVNSSCFSTCWILSWFQMATTKEKTTMPTTKVSSGYKVQLPKTFLTKYGVKVGDALTIQEVNGYIILKPLKAGPASKAARVKQTRQDAQEVDRDREEWLGFIAQAFDRSFGDESAYTSYKIKVPNPENSSRVRLVSSRPSATSVC